MLIDLLKDQSIVVRDTSAWTVGRVCEILPDAVINEHYLNPLLHAMVEGLTAEPRVASNVCWVCLDLYICNSLQPVKKLGLCMSKTEPLH